MRRYTFPVAALSIVIAALFLIPVSDTRAFAFLNAPTATPTAQPDLQIITSANAQHLKQIGRLGYGTIDEIAWSPDGKMLAIAGYVGIGVYSTDDLSKPFRFIEFETRPAPIAFLDNAALVVNSGDEVALWSIQSGKPTTSLPGNATAIAVHPDGHTVAVAGKAGLRLWFPGTDKAPVTLTAEQGIDALAFVAQGSRLVDTAGVDVSSWDLTTYTETRMHLKRIENGGPIEGYHAVFSPDGNWFAVTGWGGTALWDVRTGEGRGVGDVLDPAKSSVAFSPDSRTLAVGDENGFIDLWDSATGEAIKSLRDVSGVQLWNLAYTPDGSVLASGGSDGIIRLWDTRSDQVSGTINGYMWSIDAVAFSQDGKSLTAVNVDATAWRWDIRSGQVVSVGQGFRYGIAHGTNPYNSAVAISANARLIATGSAQEGDIRLWRPNGERRGLLETTEPADIEALVFSPDVSYLAASVLSYRGEPGGPIYIWEVQTGKRLTVWKVPGSRVSALTFNPASAVLAIGTNDGTIVLRAVQTGRGLGTFKDSTEQPIGVIAFNPNGSMFATALGFEPGEDITDFAVRVWDIRTGKQTMRLAGHTDLVGGLAFSIDGSLLASQSADGMIRLWDVKSGALLTTLENPMGYTGYTTSGLIFSPDGKVLASASDRGTVRLWGVIRIPEIDFSFRHRSACAEWFQTGSD